MGRNLPRGMSAQVGPMVDGIIQTPDSVGGGGGGGGNGLRSQGAIAENSNRFFDLGVKTAMRLKCLVYLHFAAAMLALKSMRNTTNPFVRSYAQP